MRCEICGKNIIGKPMRTKIEGSVMYACNECAKLGKIQREPVKPRKQRVASRPPMRKEPSYEVHEEYNKLVRDAREKRGWSREDLAEKIYEKVSVINRIESGKMIPDVKLAKKLENILKISIVEKIEDNQSQEFKASNIRGSTIGDIARIKKS
ncbi:MAG: multiprotein bridging factor aMBF1 [Methanobacteriaceae archaeon]|nr:multiprotein bridging factor aMBF1 [Methanobacteriaceae archaeon]